RQGRRGERHTSSKATAGSNGNRRVAAGSLRHAQAAGRSRKREVRSGATGRREINAIAGRVGEFQLDSVRGAISGVGTLLAVADIADLAIGHVIPRQRRTEGGGDADRGIRHGFDQLVAGDRRIVSEHRRGTATGGAARTRLHVGQYAVKHVVAAEQTGGGAVV